MDDIDFDIFSLVGFAICNSVDKLFILYRLTIFQFCKLFKIVVILFTTGWIPLLLYTTLITLLYLLFITGLIFCFIFSIRILSDDLFLTLKTLTVAVFVSILIDFNIAFVQLLSCSSNLT